MAIFWKYIKGTADGEEGHDTLINFTKISASGKKDCYPSIIYNPTSNENKIDLGNIVTTKGDAQIIDKALTISSLDTTGLIITNGGLKYPKDGTTNYLLLNTEGLSVEGKGTFSGEVRGASANFETGQLKGGSLIINNIQSNLFFNNDLTKRICWLNTEEPKEDTKFKGPYPIITLIDEPEHKNSNGETIASIPNQHLLISNKSSNPTTGLLIRSSSLDESWNESSFFDSITGPYVGHEENNLIFQGATVFTTKNLAYTTITWSPESDLTDVKDLTIGIKTILLKSHTFNWFPFGGEESHTLGDFDLIELYGGYFPTYVGSFTMKKTSQKYRIYYAEKEGDYMNIWGISIGTDYPIKKIAVPITTSGQISCIDPFAMSLLQERPDFRNTWES